MAFALYLQDLVVSFMLPDKNTGLDRIFVDNLKLDAGEKLCISGPSGSGKSVLLNVLAGVKKPNAGQVLWDGLDITHLSIFELDKWRKRNIGFIFQDLHILSGMTVLQNVLLMTEQNINSVNAEALNSRAKILLRDMGIFYFDRPANTLSRGEQQRVAIVRALLMSPQVLIADDPFSSMDNMTTVMALNILLKHVKETGSTLIIASSNQIVHQRIDRVEIMEKGMLLHEHSLHT
ncbi:MAG: ABC transporter ATP-binding protein [Candidatus Omnitrophica bacterium]|nr:ABC transporter ATP-binding protein [Candidatus Omnitrophota bacterium]